MNRELNYELHGCVKTNRLENNEATCVGFSEVRKLGVWVGGQPPKPTLWSNVHKH